MPKSPAAAVKHRDYMRERTRAKRAAWAAAGLCRRCGKRPPLTGHVQCQRCRKQAKDQQLRLVKKRAAAGICLRCKVRPTALGTNCETCRADSKTRRDRDRLAALTHYGCVCTCCGEKQIEFLQIDHVNNDGAAHRREIGNKIYTWLRQHNYPEGFQVLCANCNCAKGHYGVCPHQQRAGE